jgi:hypothetical protein
MIDIRDLLLYSVLAKSRGVEATFVFSEQGLYVRMYISREAMHYEDTKIIPWAELRQARMDVVDVVVNDMLDRVLTASQPMVEAIQGGAPKYTLPA